MNDLVGGQIDVLCDQATTAVPQIQGGTVKAYAVTSAQRLASLQDVPSNKEAGLPGLEVTIWNGAYAPKGTPKEVIDRWNAAIGKFVTDSSSASRRPALCRSRPKCDRPPRTPSSSPSSSSSTPRCSLRPMSRRRK
jgi:tripartite-type tricarboxylate transporter receptor subunit TctC